MPDRIFKIEDELLKLNEVMELVSSFGKNGVYATRYYSEIKTITDSRIDELIKRKQLLNDNYSH